ncbi:MAG: truncated hemoglobin [Gammaproteobacteria bacterium]
MNETTTLADQIGYDKVQLIVHSFYQQAQLHPELGPFFNHIEDFKSHEQRLSDFWWQALGGQLEQPGQFDMIGKHFPLGIKTSDLEAWLVLFGRVLGENLDMELANAWMSKAVNIAARLKQIVIDHQPLGPKIKNKS